MTIAIGFHVGDSGILLAADRQVTGADVKVGSGKIGQWFGPDGKLDEQLAITGAGNTHYLSCLADELAVWFTRSPALDIAQLEAGFEETLFSFWDRHIVPFSSFGPECPVVQLLIAAQRGSERQMWTTEFNAIKRVSRPIAVGMGQRLAAESLFQFGCFPANRDMVAAQILAAYIIFKVKQVVDYCGDDTDLLCIGTQYIPTFDRAGIRELEEVFRRISRSQVKALHRLFRSSPVEEAEIEDDEIRQDIDYLVREYSECNFARELVEAQRRARRSN